MITISILTTHSHHQPPPPTHLIIGMHFIIVEHGQELVTTLDVAWGRSLKTGWQAGKIFQGEHLQDVFIHAGQQSTKSVLRGCF